MNRAGPRLGMRRSRKEKRGEGGSLCLASDGSYFHSWEGKEGGDTGITSWISGEEKERSSPNTSASCVREKEGKKERRR